MYETILTFALQQYRSIIMLEWLYQIRGRRALKAKLVTSNLFNASIVDISGVTYQTEFLLVTFIRLI